MTPRNSSSSISTTPSLSGGKGRLKDETRSGTSSRAFAAVLQTKATADDLGKPLRVRVLNVAAATSDAHAKHFSQKDLPLAATA